MIERLLPAWCSRPLGVLLLTTIVLPASLAAQSGPQLAASKDDTLLADNDGDAVVSPGDELLYEIAVQNVGGAAASGVQLHDLIPAHTSVVPGSVAASQGIVDSEDPVRVQLGDLGAGAAASVSFAVTIEDPVPLGVTEIVNQGTVTSNELPAVLTDDPEVGGEADSTVTLVTAAPILVVEKTDVLFSDADADGLASPGDELLYQITVANFGNTWATGVVLTDVIPLSTTLVPGTVQASQGTVVSEDPVEADLGQVAPEGAAGPALVSFRVVIHDPFPTDRISVENQAVVTSVGLLPVASDDPDTPESADSTVTPVFITPDLHIDNVMVAEGADARFTVTLSIRGNRPVSVDYATADGAATAGSDYQARAGTLTFPAGTFSAQVVVPVVDDLLDELDEDFAVVLLNPVGANLGHPRGLAHILDDDEPPLVSIDDVTIMEGDSGATDAVFTVTLSAPSSFDVSIDYATVDGTAEAGPDYQAIAGTLVLPAGASSGSLTVPVLGDLSDESDEEFSVELSNPVQAVLADPVGLGTILDDDETEISIDDLSIEEGDAGSANALFTVSLSSQSATAVSVDYTTADGTATAGVDYGATSGTLTLAAGETWGTVAVPVFGDLLLEPDETFTVELTNPTGAALGDCLGLGTILDDEGCSGPELLRNPGAEEPLVGGELPGWTEVAGADWRPRSASPPPIEGQAYFFAGMTALAELSQDVDVSAYAPVIDTGGQLFSFQGFVRSRDEVPRDAARIVVEYRDASNSVVLDVFDSGELASVAAWQEVSDVRAAPPGTRWLGLRLETTNFGADGDNDGYFDGLSLRSLGTAVLFAGDAMVEEGDSGTTVAPLEVLLSCAVPTEVSVTVATADGTALAGDDYQAVGPEEVVLPAGAVSATIEVPVYGDLIVEPDELFTLELSDPFGALLVGPQGLGLILNDDDDTDLDGVPDELDVCLGTRIPERVPSRKLRPNRYALVDEDTVFDTARRGRRPRIFTVGDTAGCSCEQIILGLDLGRGHRKFGCSLGAMRRWVRLVGR